MVDWARVGPDWMIGPPQNSPMCWICQSQPSRETGFNAPKNNFLLDLGLHATEPLIPQSLVFPFYSKLVISHLSISLSHSVAHRGHLSFIQFHYCCISSIFSSYRNFRNLLDFPSLDLAPSLPHLYPWRPHMSRRAQDWGTDASAFVECSNRWAGEMSCVFRRWRFLAAQVVGAFGRGVDEYKTGTLTECTQRTTVVKR